MPGNDIFVGGGGFDEMIGEGGDDIFVGSDAQDKMDGMSGFDWVTYKNDTIRRHGRPDAARRLQSSRRSRHRPPRFSIASPKWKVCRDPSSPTSCAATTSTRRHRHVQRQDGALDAAGIALTNLRLSISGLQALPRRGRVTGFGTGNIILGGDGSDIIEGRGGDDLIDGDKWLNVRISVRANADGTGPEIASYDSMAPMIPLMLNRTYNPGQLVAVREIKPGRIGGPISIPRCSRAPRPTTRSPSTTTARRSISRRRRHRDRRSADAARRDRPPHAYRAAAVRRSVVDARAGPQSLIRSGSQRSRMRTAATVTTGDMLSVSIAGVTDADSPDRSDHRRHPLHVAVRGRRRLRRVRGHHPAAGAATSRSKARVASSSG